MIEKLACSLGRNDEEPNIRLAEELVRNDDAGGIAEIVNGLGSGKEEVADDCIKVLYEVGYRKPGLIAEYAEAFVPLLRSRKNRLVWGSAIALSTIAELRSDYLFGELGEIRHAYEKGSVITVDNCVGIFAGIAKAKEKYRKKIFPILIGHLGECRSKEVGQHAERAFVCVDRGNAEEFRDVLLKRYDALAAPQKKRVDKLLRKIEKGDYSGHS